MLVFDLGVEEVATAVAIALKADKIVLSGRGQGIYDEKGNLRTEILTGEAGKIIEQQLAACNPALFSMHLASFYSWLH